MDKKTIFAFLLIGLILILTQTDFYRDKILKLPPKPVITETQPDSSLIGSEPFRQSREVKEDAVPIKAVEKPALIQERTSEEQNDLFLLVNRHSETNFEKVLINADNYTASINPRGAVISSWKLENFNFRGDEKVELIENDYGNLGIYFINAEDTIYTYDAYFKPDKNSITFDDGKEVDSVKFILDLGDGRQIIKTFTFYKSEYIFDCNIEIIGLASQFDKSQYAVAWHSGLKYTELDYSNNISKEDVQATKAYVYQGGSKEDLSLPDKPFQKKSRSEF